MESIRLPFLMWVGLILSVEELNKTKRLSIKELLSDYSSWNTGPFQPSYSFWNAGCFGVSGLLARILKVHIHFPWSPARQLCISGLLSLHNCVSQCLTIISLHTYIHPVGPLSLENLDSYSRLARWSWECFGRSQSALRNSHSLFTGLKAY